ncbi:MAG: L,D-transpeptidase [Gammaproteobacteria bacterium]
MTKKIDIHIASQALTLSGGKDILSTYPVSTAKNGGGELSGSECTPRGRHIIRAKIGAGARAGSVFVGRRQTGEIYTDQRGYEYPDRDWILSRILWLSGCEKGYNRLGNVDTMRRYIYIHGCPDELMKGEPDSHGCIRMGNADVIDLFDQIAIGTAVYIHDDSSIKS